MFSIDRLDELEAMHSRFFSLRFDLLTPSELLATLERYAFLMGRLKALRYELTSPFGWHA
ncbi:hypothetical protein [Mycobacterium sp. M23085]|uniref:hypothetical protein n=1 Tax=Mycobacterium sp. M23085 TaxID=3378087 RepID=UPI003877BD41